MQTSNAAAAAVDVEPDTDGIPAAVAPLWEECAVCERLLNAAVDTVAVIASTRRLAHVFCYRAVRTRREARS